MGGRPLRVLLTGGGTAGHVFPALALATELRRLEPGVEFLYIGTRAGLEAGLVPAAGLPFATVRAQGLVGRRPLAAMRALWELVRGYREARQLIGRFRPHVAVGTGGYVTGPVLLAAARAGVPLVLHEQNAFPGAANRWLSRFAELVAVPFDETHRYFGRAARVVTTGNPVRPEIVTTSRDEGLRAFGLDGERPVVLIVSGSRGAQAINEASVAMLTGPPLDAQVILVTGRRYYDAVVARLAAAGVSLDALHERGVRVLPFAERMELALAAADLVVSRAGATTMAELTARGLPSILVPSPNVSHDHQRYNAEMLRRAGAAVVLDEAACNGPRLSELIRTLLQDGARLRTMAAAARSLGRPDAGAVLARLVLEVAAKHWPARQR